MLALLLMLTSNPAPNAFGEFVSKLTKEEQVLIANEEINSFENIYCK